MCVWMMARLKKWSSKLWSYVWPSWRRSPGRHVQLCWTFVLNSVTWMRRYIIFLLVFRAPFSVTVSCPVPKISAVAGEFLAPWKILMWALTVLQLTEGYFKDLIQPATMLKSKRGWEGYKSRALHYKALICIGMPALGPSKHKNT